MARAVATDLRRRGIDALTVQESGRAGYPDEEHLAYALAEGRVLATMDADFLALDAAGAQHAGIVYAHPQSLTIGEWVRGLLLIHEILDPEEIAGKVEYL